MARYEHLPIYKTATPSKGCTTATLNTSASAASTALRSLRQASEASRLRVGLWESGHVKVTDAAAALGDATEIESNRF